MERGLEISRRIDALQTLLRERSEGAWADRLDTAIAGGSTGTESLFRAGAALRDLLSSGVAKRLGVEGEAKDLAGLIDRHLKI